MFNHQRLKCYCMALELAKKAPSLLARWPRGHYYLEDQLKRALSSIILNISEGNGRTGTKERGRFFTIARGSANESASIIDVALALRLISEQEAVYYHDHLLQVIKMLCKLR